jgi:hypothetical protein
MMDRKAGDLVLTAAFPNAMKCIFSGEELRAAIMALAGHFAGEQFDRNTLSFRYWTRDTP